MKKLTALITFLSILLVGCQGGGGIDYSSVDYFTGSIGLQMRFLEGTPPREIFVGDSNMDVILEIYNKGTQDIGSTYGYHVGYIYLSGFDTNYFNPTPSGQGNYNFQAEGKSEYNPLGEIYTAKEFKDTGMIYLPGGVSRLDQTLKATACYPYKTKAAEKVCVDPDIRNLIKDKVCRVHDISTNGQGAPITITRVEEDILGSDVIFKIHFTNTGGGQVYYDSGSSDMGVANCHTGLEYNDMNLIKLNHIRLGGTDFTSSCSPSTLRLTSNSGYMICRCSGGGCVNTGKQAYETLLEVELEYGYRQSIQKPFRLIRIPLTSS